MGIISNHNDTEGGLVRFCKDEELRLAKGERHRLVGLEDYRIVVDIWQHTNSIPPNDVDIVRLQDDFKIN